MPYWKLALLILIFSLQVYARKVALVWGGGGEHSSYTSTMFDRDMRAWLGRLQGANYEIRIAYGTGFSDSEKMVNEVLGSGFNNEAFTPTSVQDQVQDLIRRLSLSGEGSLKSGDQIFVLIDTHGESPIKTPGALTHFVRTGYGDTPEKREGFLLDVLQPLKVEAEKRGVKLAIVDLSCYGGSTLALAGAKTCVIAASAAEEPSYQHFALKMASSVRPQRNLESSYLEARKYVDSFGLNAEGTSSAYLASPEISSFAHSMTKMYFLSNISHLAPQLKLENTPCVSCQKHQAYLQEVHATKAFDVKAALSDYKGPYQMAELKMLADSISMKAPQAQLKRDLKTYYMLERQIYDRVYLDFSVGAHPNPCRDFDF